MAHIDGRLEKRQRLILDDDDDDEKGNKEDGASIVLASTTSDGPIALEDNLCFRIAEFLSPFDAAGVCKIFLKAATKTSESVLSRIHNNDHVDADWRLRLAQHLLDRYKRYYFGDETGATEITVNQRPTPQGNPSLHPRLLWYYANKLPLAQRSEYPIIAPPT